jgi:hypothetical protein
MNVGAERRSARYRIESRAYDGKVLGYTIDWGDGSESTLEAQADCPKQEPFDQRVAQHEYAAEGLYPVLVTVRYGECGATVQTASQSTDAAIGPQPGTAG